MRNLLALSLIALVSACSPGQFVANIEGFNRFDGEVPAETTTGNEPQITTANIVAGRPGYLEFHIVDNGAPLTHIFMEVEDEVFVADIGDLQLIDACDYLDAANSGSLGADLMGLVTSCTAACSEACECFTECNELPTDLGVAGSPSALCAASCSQSGGAITETEFADTFADIYGCTPPSCSTSAAWVGMIQINYPEIKTEAIMATPVSSPQRGSLTNDNMQGAELSVGKPQMCRPY